MKDNMPEIKTVGEKRHIQMYQPDDSHEMVEFYMLTANQYVASYLDAKGIVYPKRSHPKPIDICKFENICKLQLPSHCPKEFHVFLKLTCMQPACYTIDKQKVGHFALGMQYYTHFTSPIRRYIDIVNQRLLFEDYSYTPKELEDICKLANEEEMRNKRIDDLQSHLSDCAHARKHKHDRFRGIIYGLQPKVAMVYVVETMMTTQIDIKLFATSFKDFFVLHEHKWIGKRMSFQLYDEVWLKILSIQDKVYYRPVRK